MSDPFSEYEEKFREVAIKHFNPEEFMCKCGSEFGLCDILVLDMDFIMELDEFRNDLGIPFRVTSGYRCGFHPIEVKKIHPGPHRTGKAVDIAVVGASTYQILYGLGMHNAHGHPFMGIGLNQKGDHDERFLHLDMCEAKPWRPRPHVWTY